MAANILYPFTLMSLFIIYIFNFICIIISFNSPLFQYPGFSILGVFSILLYSFVIIICAIKRDLFFFFLPFIILAFPNVINDFLPSFMMGPVMESRVASFSYITHIDIFLVYGLYILKNHKKDARLVGKMLELEGALRCMGSSWVITQIGFCGKEESVFPKGEAWANGVCEQKLSAEGGLAASRTPISSINWLFPGA